MDKIERAEQWAKKKLEEGIKGPIRISSFETIEHPEEYLKTNLLRIRHSSQIEAALAYSRIEKLAKLLKNSK